MSIARLTLQAQELRAGCRSKRSAEGKWNQTYLAEVVKGTDTPLTVRLDTHDLVQTHTVWRAASPECACRFFSTILGVRSATAQTPTRRRNLRCYNDTRKSLIVELVRRRVTLQTMKAVSGRHLERAVAKTETRLPKVQCDTSGSFFWTSFASALKSWMVSWMKREGSSSSGSGLGSRPSNTVLTSSTAFPGKSCSPIFETHFSSACEVVACHRYKQLNYMKRSSASPPVHACATRGDLAPDLKLTSTLHEFPRPRSNIEWSALRISSNGLNAQLLPWRTRPRIAAK